MPTLAQDDQAQVDAIKRRQALDQRRRDAARNMRTGGSFAAAIGDAYMVADSRNQRRLVDAFGDLFDRFAPNQEF